MNALLRIAFAAALVLAIAGCPGPGRDLVKLSDELPSAESPTTPFW
jgi:hypothetical protein